jgi:hypothetical protein
VRDKRLRPKLTRSPARRTGAVALALGVAYLLAVAALESRGPLKPPPPEVCPAIDFSLRTDT